mgnify:CR=1
MQFGHCSGLNFQWAEKQAAGIFLCLMLSYNARRLFIKSAFSWRNLSRKLRKFRP